VKNKKNLKGNRLKKQITRHGLFIKLPIRPSMVLVQNEIFLGRSVLDKALLDCIHDLKEFKWFDIENEDFVTICYIADVELHQTIERVSTVLEKIQEKT